MAYISSFKGKSSFSSKMTTILINFPLETLRFSSILFKFNYKLISPLKGRKNFWRIGVFHRKRERFLCQKPLIHKSFLHRSARIP